MDDPAVDPVAEIVVGVFVEGDHRFLAEGRPQHEKRASLRAEDIGIAPTAFEGGAAMCLEIDGGIGDVLCPCDQAKVARRGENLGARVSFVMHDAGVEDAWDAVRTDGGIVPADGAVVAAGVWSKPLAAELGDDLPLETERGYHLMIRDPEAVPRLPVADADGKFVATPMELGIRIAGTVELAGLKAPPNWERARVLLRHVHRMFPALKESYPEERISTWMGHRPSLPDSLPAIGRSRRSPDVVYAFGHGHVGMAGAPMTGKLVAELLSGKTPSIDLTPFSPARFG